MLKQTMHKLLNNLKPRNHCYSRVVSDLYDLLDCTLESINREFLRLRQAQTFRNQIFRSDEEIQ